MLLSVVWGKSLAPLYSLSLQYSFLPVDRGAKAEPFKELSQTTPLVDILYKTVPLSNTHRRRKCISLG